MTFECSDPQESVLPPLRRWNQCDALRPRPRAGWFIFLTLPPDVRDTRIIGAWICAVLQAQARGRDGHGRRHMIARDARGRRFLLVHPATAEAAAEDLDLFNSAFENCNCGGLDCLAGEEQARAAAVLAGRRWRRLRLSERTSLLAEHEMPIGIAFSSDVSWMRGDSADWVVEAILSGEYESAAMAA